MEDMYVGGRGPLDNMRSLEQYLPDPGGHRGQGMSIILHFLRKINDQIKQQMERYEETFSDHQKQIEGLEVEKSQT